MLRIAASFAAGRVLVALIQFLRNVLLARLIPVEDYGIASTFVVTVSLIQMLGDLALDRLVVQNRHGGAPWFVAAVQSLALLRGALLAGLLLAGAPYVAALFGQAEIVWAYQVMALVPLLHALLHLDTVRQQREMRFGATVRSDLAGAGLSIAALWPLAAMLGDFRTILGLIFIEYAGRAVASHLLAERPFRVGWDRKTVRTALGFGAPLIAGGMLAFLTLQGDRIIVANRFTPYDLGLFSAALTLAMTPSLLLARVTHPLFLPTLSRHQETPERFAPAAMTTLEAMALLAAALMAGFALLGPPVFRIAFGEAYATGGPFVVLLGIAFALRLARAGPATIAVARGHTMQLMLANLLRVLAVPAGLLVVAAGGDIEALVLVGIGAEAAALALALLLVRRLGNRPDLGRALVLYGLLGGLAFACVLRTVLVPGSSAALVADGAAVLSAAGIALLCRGLRTGLASGFGGMPTDERE